MNRQFRSIVIVIAVLMISAAVAVAAIPHTLSYQGALKNDDGSAVIDGEYLLTFTLWTALDGGSNLWQETNTVQVQESAFSTVLGLNTPLTPAFDQPYWLGITIGADPELQPRLPLTAAPYALNTPITAVADVDWIFSGDDMIAGNSGNVGIGAASPAAKLDVEGLGGQESGVPGYDEVIGIFRQTGSDHTALAVEANPGKDAIMYFSENGLAKWGIRNDSDAGDQFQIRIHNSSGGWSRAMVVDTLGLIGMGTRTPTTRLDVAGELRVRGGSPGEHRVLVSDADGVGSWQPIENQYILSPFSMTYSGNVYDFDREHVGCALTITTQGFAEYLSASLPLNIPSSVNGAPQKLTSITVEYRADNLGAYIDNCWIRMSTGGATFSNLVYNTTDRTSTTWDSFTLNIGTPREITGSLILRFQFYFNDSGTEYSVHLGNITVNTTSQ